MINQTWFDSLTTVGLREHHSFLKNLPTRVERIANFGCWSGDEPFALLWTLDSNEVTVVEIKQEHIRTLEEERDIISHRYPQSLYGRKVNVLCRDMSEEISELSNQYFDLAYCEDVLYNLQERPSALKSALSQMIRIIKPGGYIVVVEPKFGVEFEWREDKFMGTSISTPYPLNGPKDMSYLFKSKNLTKVNLSGCHAFTYCYQK
jgi:SAM-dependent methyltransferase